MNQETESRTAELVEAFESLTVPENRNMAVNLVTLTAQAEAATKKLYNIQPEAKPEQKQDKK